MVAAKSMGGRGGPKEGRKNRKLTLNRVRKGGEVIIMKAQKKRRRDSWAPEQKKKGAKRTATKKLKCRSRIISIRKSRGKKVQTCQSSVEGSQNGRKELKRWPGVGESLSQKLKDNASYQPRNGHWVGKDVTNNLGGLRKEQINSTGT